jgi:hypothetical protein
MAGSALPSQAFATGEFDTCENPVEAVVRMNASRTVRREVDLKLITAILTAEVTRSNLWNPGW